MADAALAHMVSRQVPQHWAFQRVVRWLTTFAVLTATFSTSSPARALTPESPEVRKLIEQGLASLEGHAERRLGGLCLIALAFIKNGAPPDNPHVVAALEACEKPEGIVDVYSNGLAIIFLAEHDPVAHRELISRYVGMLMNRQKKNGGWGYDAY